MSVVIFIDANQYLNLFRIGAATKLLDAIEGQAAHLFIAAQTADEVWRRKLDVASEYFRKQQEELAELETPVFDHLLQTDGKETEALRNAFAAAKEARERIKKTSPEALMKISRSEDALSLRLQKLFSKAQQPTNEQIGRARLRKERGNPPGDAGDPLGDQIAWEQFLDHCAEEKRIRAWILTTDTDYVTVHDKIPILNSFLHRELVAAPRVVAEVNCFRDAMIGLQDFVKRNPALKGGELPSDEEAKQIRQEILRFPEQSVPYDTSSSTGIHAVRSLIDVRRSHVAALGAGARPAWGQGVWGADTWGAGTWQGPAKSEKPPDEPEGKK